MLYVVSLILTFNRSGRFGGQLPANVARLQHAGSLDDLIYEAEGNAAIQFDRLEPRQAKR
jgi:hypothetical protein